MLIILTGKTASGKDTIKDALLSKYPNLRRVITTTSRNIRSGEKNGIDYYFITKDEFKDKIKKGQFIEYVQYGGNLYGTTKEELENTLNHHDVIWKIDPSRAGEVRDFIKRAFPKNQAEKINRQIMVVYLNVSDDVILQRLNSRGLNGSEIKERMEDDQRIWKKFHDKYDYVVWNMQGKLNLVVEDLVKLIEKHQLLS